jgi:hypothetical protein
MRQSRTSCAPHGVLDLLEPNKTIHVSTSIGDEPAAANVLDWAALALVPQREAGLLWST